MAGLLGGLQLFRRVVELESEGVLQPVRYDAARIAPLSPWATRGGLYHHGWDPGTFGTGAAAGPVSVDEATRCAPVKKARAILHGVIASRPLVAVSYDGGTDTSTVLRGDAAPTWLYRTDTDFSPQQRMASILDDHLFHEASVIALYRGAGAELGGRGAILDAVHIPYEWWRVDDDGVLLVHDQPVDPDSVLYIPGPSRGLCVEAQDEVRQWRAIARAIATRLNSPTPSIVLRDPARRPGEADEQEVADLVADAAAARRSPDGAVMYAADLEVVIVPNNDDSGMFLNARNGLRLDFANHTNMPASLLDGSAATASLTYSTQEGDRNEFADLSLDYWTTPITRALSQDAIVPRGTRVRFDFGDLFTTTNAPTGASTQD